MNILKIMQQAKEMQGKMAEMQERAAQFLVVGSAGAGKVEITMTCKGVVQGVKISPDVLDPSDPSMVEDLVLAAMNDARKQADDTLASQTREMMEGMGLPADFKLPG